MERRDRGAREPRRSRSKSSWIFLKGKNAATLVRVADISAGIHCHTCTQAVLKSESPRGLWDLCEPYCLLKFEGESV